MYDLFVTVLPILSLLFAPVFVGLLSGADRILTAALQSRKGPPLLQPFYDMLKLLGKEVVLTNPWQSFCVVLYLCCSATSLALFYSGGDLLMVFFVQAAGVMFFIMSAIACPSPYSQIGAQRELIQVLAYEPLVLLSIVGFYLASGSFSVSAIANSECPLICQLPLMVIVFGYVLTVKLRKSPFDVSASHHAHQEIVRGVYTEFSGRNLFLVELAHWYEIALFLSMLGLLWATSIFGIIAIIAVAYILEVLIDNITSRMTWSWLLSNVWGIGMLLAIINILWLGLR